MRYIWDTCDARREPDARVRCGKPQTTTGTRMGAGGLANTLELQSDLEGMHVSALMRTMGGHASYETLAGRIELRSVLAGLTSALAGRSSLPRGS